MGSMTVEVNLFYKYILLCAFKIYFITNISVNGCCLGNLQGQEKVLQTGLRGGEQ
jgi:hypothetical protein